MVHPSNRTILRWLLLLVDSKTYKKSAPAVLTVGILSPKLVFAVCYQNRARVKEKILSFLAHQKLLKSDKYSPR